MARRKRVFRSVVATRREEDQKLAPRSCDHHHGTPESATTCMVTRVRELLRVTPLLELTAKIEGSYSRHDWFPL